MFLLGLFAVFACNIKYFQNGIAVGDIDKFIKENKIDRDEDGAVLG